MDYQKALDILGLKHNFTEEEFKTSYRRLSQMYHPDKYKEGTELHLQMLRKQQDINAAREYIKNHLRENNLNNYKTKKLNDIKIFMSEDTNINDHDFQEMKNKVNDVIYRFETDIWMSFVKTQQQVDSMYDLAIKAIKNILDNFITQFYQKNYIDRNEVKENIDFENNLEKIYDQLLKIREQCSKEVKAKKQLDEEIEQYKGYAGYERLKTLIDICKHNAICCLKQNNFQNIEQEIKKMHQLIKQEVFDVYYTLKKKISDLGSIINNITDESIKNEYFSIYNNFELGTSFYDTEQSILKLEKRISEYQEIELKKQNQKVIEESINKIYQSLIARYSDAIKQYNVVTEYEVINANNNLLNKLLELFRKGCEEFKNIEYFQLFNQITFKNGSDDYEALKNILEKFQHNNCKVYIKRKDKLRLFDQTSFHYLDTDQMQIYQVTPTKVFNKINITQKELDEDYISLEELLNISQYVGHCMMELGNFEEKYIYYTTDGYIIYQEPFDERIRILINPGIHSRCTNRHNKHFDEKMKDKTVMQYIIENQIRQQVEEYKKQQASTTGSYSPDSRIYDDPVFNTGDGYNNKWYQHRRR